MMSYHMQMSTNSFLERGVDLEKLASMTKNFSGAEIEGLVKDATSHALNRNVDFNDLHKPLDEESIKVSGQGVGHRGRGCSVMVHHRVCWNDTYQFPFLVFSNHVLW
jgi:hypothetical protein